MKKVIIFDMDGVIFNSVGAITRYNSLNYPGLTKQDHLESLTRAGVGIKLNHKKVPWTPEEREANRANYIVDKANSPMFPGMKELLEHLRDSGTILALNTSAYTKNSMPLLEGAGIANMFDFLGTRDVAESKVEKFLLVDEKYGATKEEMLFITDTLIDLEDAEEAGIPTIAVTWGAHDRSYFERENHENLVAIVDSVADLEVFIKNLLG